VSEAWKEDGESKKKKQQSFEKLKKPCTCFKAGIFQAASEQQDVSWNCKNWAKLNLVWLAQFW